MQAVRIYSHNIGMEFSIKMSHANNEKQKTTTDGRNRTTKSRKNKNARKMETYKCLGIYEVDTIKHAEMKKIMSISGEG